MPQVTLTGVTDTFERTTLTDPKYPYHCTIPWQVPMDNMYRWNEVTAQAMEMFGLPGDRYVTEVSEEFMTWSFQSDKDAVLFRLRFGEFVTA